jgi:xylose dehydrogenase (NAD/NADP)
MNTADRKIRWGVLGYARIARLEFIPAIQRSANGEFFALASRDEAKLGEARTKFPGVTRTYGDYDQLLSDPEVDAVYIPLPNSLHREWTIKAAEHGKHVLCEKPAALTAAECRAMIAACAKHGVTLMEAFMYRYSERTRQVVEVLRGGVLGDVKQINATFRFFLTNPASIKLRPELGGGALYDIGCYPVNFIGLVLDEMTRSVSGAGPKPESVVAECVRANGVDVGFAALLRYPAGVMASVQCGFEAHKRVVAEIIGTKGVLEIPDTYFDNAGALTLTVGEERREIPVAASDRYRLEVEDFSASILLGGVPHVTLAETLRNAELADRLLAASRRSE